MKRTLLLAATLLAPSGIACAQTPEGVYVGAGAGAAFLQDQSAQRVVTPRAPVAVASKQSRFDTGARVSAEVGYAFANGLRLELEGTALGANRTRTRGGRPVTPAVALTDGRASAYEGDAGLFVNAIYEFDLSGLGAPIDVRPYVGGGVGYLRTLQRDLPQLRANTAFTRVEGDRNALGAQAILGAAFPIEAVPGLAITAEYRGTERTGGRYDAELTGPRGKTKVRFDDDSNFSHSALLGVRYTFGQSSPPPPPAAAAPLAAPEAASRTYLVFFDWDRAELTARARQIVADAAQASTRVQATRIEVNGYTDLSGTARYNEGLSLRRAQAVQAELVRDGVPAGETAVRGRGESDPLVPTAAGVREPQNRRVEIILR